MNKIFKTKWCTFKQCYIVCSELTKRAGKLSGSTLLLTCGILTSSFAIAETVTSETNGEIVAKEYSESVTVDDSLSITTTPASGVTWTIPKGLVVRGNKDVTINGDVDVNVTLASENNPKRSADSNASYGIAVGYEYNGGTSTDNANLTVNNATINVTNTANTKLGIVNFSGATAPAGHQLSGLKIYRTTGATPTFVSNGLLSINVTDNSTAKIGDYLAGIYISGDGSKATLNDSKITIVANGKHSAALKIGKPNLPNPAYSTEYQGASIISNGNMMLDTTQTTDSATVRLFGNKSSLIADSNSSSGEIHSGNSAIVFDVQDYDTTVTYIISDQVSRNENAVAQVVRLNNTIIDTTSETASLIKARAEMVSSIAVAFAGNKVAGWFNNGNFAATNAEFTLSGSQSKATAASKGWLVETEALDNGSKWRAATDGAVSSLTVNLKDQATAIGLMHKNSASATYSSTLDVNVSNNATWKLAKKEDLTDQRSTISSLNLSNSGTLDAGTNLTGSNAEYFVKLTSDGTTNNGTLTSTGGVITTANKITTDLLTVEGNYTGADSAKLTLDTKLMDGDEKSATAGSSTSDVLYITGDSGGTTDITINNIGGTGDLTKEGIKVVKVDGTSASDNFTLKGDGVVSNDSISVRAEKKHQFTYRLYQGTTNDSLGTNGIPSGTDTADIDTNDWYLRSTCTDGSHTVGSSVSSSKYDGLGCVGDDTIAIESGANIDKVEGAGGNDTITITGNAIVTGDVYGGNAGVDNSANSDGNDNITVSDTATISGSIYGQTGNDIITVTNTAKIVGSVNGGDGDDTFTWSDTSTITSFNGENGSDTATVSSTGYDGSQVLDGGDDTETADGYIDTLNLNSISVTANGSMLKNWETINLNNTTLNLVDSLQTSGNASNGLNINAGSTLSLAGTTATVTGQVTNSGTINLTSTSTATETLNITGNYTGNSGSTIKMNTNWNAPGDSNGSNSESDVLNISGTATGTTTVIPVKADGTENIIDGNVQQVYEIINTIPVITVGISGNTVFSGTASTTGASEAQLAKRTVNGTDQYYWTLAALPRPTPVPIFDNKVPAYVQTPWVNMEQAYAVLRTLHERRSENQILAWNNCNACEQSERDQTWVRLLGSSLETEGKTRLNFDLDTKGIQIGHDFAIKRTDEGGHRLTGIYGAYSRGDAKFYDKFRAQNGLVISDKLTGTVKTDMWSLGLTHTRYSPNGSYLDLVGQFSHIHNKYQSRNGVGQKQKGLSFILSAEAGHPFALNEHSLQGNGWLLEPQAQLIYQMVNLKSFTDKTAKTVDQPTQHGLRGRVGLRLAYNRTDAEKLYTNTFYVVANVWNDFVKPKAVHIGTDEVRERYASTWGEIGIGGQLPISKNSSIYADGRYERNLNGVKRSGYRGTIGYKYTWK
ncbi:outer membrane autotransporter protein [Cricetibacter osteomyelitidis]|uniref:Outer membrane autotransporter protein n=1 Tax=Cricetibacter osteomyelitidis TaxID=1521931 RepID=A0A4R2TIQ5_9PAST|nr:autotransporter outer membrane beta-barrel domain-containing protein [Cricetibacter osteomyelitidis]TCP94682.1 outer membrane autotransporter protein [Cricetibacter osteomyelitidis]